MVIVPSLRPAMAVDVRSTSIDFAWCSFACAEAPSTAATPAIRAYSCLPYLVMKYALSVTGPGLRSAGNWTRRRRFQATFAPVAAMAGRRNRAWTLSVSSVDRDFAGAARRHAGNPRGPTQHEDRHRLGLCSLPPRPGLVVSGRRGRRPGSRASRWRRDPLGHRRRLPMMTMTAGTMTAAAMMMAAAGARAAAMAADPSAAGRSPRGPWRVPKLPQPVRPRSSAGGPPPGEARRPAAAETRPCPGRAGRHRQGR